MFGTGVPPIGLLLLVLLGFTIATTVNTFAMEAAVLFVPAFLYVFPAVVPGFPHVGPKAAIGLALFVELFGYSSSVTAYWFRHQIDFHVAKQILAITIPVAVLARVGSYLVPSSVLMLAFSVLLVALSVVLYESHEHGPSILEVALEKPVGYVTLPDRAHDALGRVRLTFEHAAGRIGLVDSVHDDYEPRTRLLADGGTVEGGTRDDLHLDWFDRTVAGVGGALAGLVGIAIGELTQTTLAVRKKVSLEISTGTSALVLHLTIVAALVTNVALLRFAPGIAGEGFTVPFGVGAFVAFGCLFGGQMGAYLNNRLSEATVMRLLIAAYFLVGLLVAVRTLVLGGAAH